MGIIEVLVQADVYLDGSLRLDECGPCKRWRKLETYDVLGRAASLGEGLLGGGGCGESVERGEFEGELPVGGELKHVSQGVADELWRVDRHAAHAEAADRGIAGVQTPGLGKLAQWRTGRVAEQDDAAARGQQVEVGVDLFRALGVEHDIHPTAIGDFADLVGEITAADENDVVPAPLRSGCARGTADGADQRARAAQPSPGCYGLPDSARCRMHQESFTGAQASGLLDQQRSGSEGAWGNGRLLEGKLAGNLHGKFAADLHDYAQTARASESGNGCTDDRPDNALAECPYRARCLQTRHERPAGRVRRIAAARHHIDEVDPGDSHVYAQLTRPRERNVDIGDAGGLGVGSRAVEEQCAHR